MKIIIFRLLFIAVVLSACTPEGNQRRSERRAERKLARLVERNPQLVKTDTIWHDTTAMVPKISDSVRVETPVDTAAVDSLTDHFKTSVDSVTLDSLNKGFKSILKRAGDMDTTINNGTTKVRIRKKNGVTNINIEVQPPPVKLKVPVIVNKVEPVKPLNFWERIFFNITNKVGVLGWVFILVLILLSIRWGIKKFFLD